MSLVGVRLSCAGPAGHAPKPESGLRTLATRPPSSAFPPFPRQAYARTLRYLYAPVDELEASPDAKYFPGLPPAGTLPVPGTVTRTVGGCQAA